jgi:CheY-like chemotaxis protein
MNEEDRSRPIERKSIREASATNMKAPKSILLVEDNPADVLLTQEAFRTTNDSIRLHVATDGVEAMAFLRRGEGNTDAPRPDLILLDLNLPKMDGREVLTQVKSDNDLKTIPTVILTTSDADVDIEKCYQLQANGYLNKPVDYEAFEDLVTTINAYWMTMNRLPRRRHNV